MVGDGGVQACELVGVAVETDGGEAVHDGRHLHADRPQRLSHRFGGGGAGLGDRVGSRIDAGGGQVAANLNRQPLPVVRVEPEPGQELEELVLPRDEHVGAGGAAPVVVDQHHPGRALAHPEHLFDGAAASGGIEPTEHEAGVDDVRPCPRRGAGRWPSPPARRTPPPLGVHGVRSDVDRDVRERRVADRQRHSQRRRLAGADIGHHHTATVNHGAERRQRHQIGGAGHPPKPGRLRRNSNVRRHRNARSSRPCRRGRLRDSPVGLSTTRLQSNQH